MYCWDKLSLLSLDFFFPTFQVRDYIHVVDLADGHLAALSKLSDPSVGMLFFVAWVAEVLFFY